MKEKVKENRGVTLLEIILVLTMVAVLAAMAIPNLESEVAKRKADGAIATLRSISHCVRQYRLAHDDGITEPPPPNFFSDIEPPTATYSAGNNCVDPNQFDKDYTFDYARTGSTVAVTAMTDRYGGRTILLSPAGNLEEGQFGAGAVIYDCKGKNVSNCGPGNPALVRQMFEMTNSEDKQTF